MQNKIFTALFGLTLFANALHAQTIQPDSSNKQKDTTRLFSLHFQMTYINQTKPKMSAKYSGPYSLQVAKEHENSLTSTLFLGMRLWKGANVFFNPELAGGSGLSGAQGMGGSTNGETFRVGNPSPTLYVARGYLEQTIALSKQTENQEEDANQFAMNVPVDYLKFTVGKFSLADIFDNNTFSNSPRTQFLNWGLMNNGSWDFAANVRGYTYIAAAELDKGSLNYKFAVANLPKEANGADINTHLDQEISLNAQITASYNLNRYPGHFSVLYFNNRADMGNYAQAIAQSGMPVDTPNVVSTRERGRHKWGLGINFDQTLAHDLGLFGRFGFNNGKTETWNFTEIDQTVSLGIAAKGSSWYRKDDNAGFAFLVNGLSKDHREYLSLGGNGFILGDGKLNYAPESIAELYYTFKPSTTMPLWFTGDYQFALNPGYNKDRGPANVFSVRVHTEF